MVELDEKVGLEILLGQVDLSQRAYNNLMDIMNAANVKLPGYKSVLEYEKNWK